MKNSIKAKIVSIIIISSFIFGFFSPLFANKAKAMTPGEAVGKAVAMGVACFAEQKLESFVAGLLSRVIAIPEGKITKFTDFASVPVIDANSPKTSKSIETSNALMKSKDCIRDVVAKIWLDYIVDETVKWIQGGGEPGFVQNWDTFAKDAFNVGVGEVINDSSLSFLCSPFRAQVKLSFLPVQSFKHQVSCTLDQITGNIENFYNDFSNGGWLAYDRMWEPQNNYFGAYMMASDEALIRAMEKRNAALNEAVASKGFLGVKRCVSYNNAGVYDCVMNTCPDDNSACLEQCKRAACTGYEIVTPGDAVGTAVGKAITSDADWAANIHSWVAALVNAVINRLTKEGLSMMKGDTNDSYDYNAWGGRDRLNSIQQSAKNQFVKQMRSNASDIQTVLKNKTTALSYFSQAISLLLDYTDRGCQPLISDAEMRDLLTDLNNLTTEINELTPLVSQINEFISYVDGLTVDQFIQNQSTIEDKFISLTSKAGTYGNVQNSLDEIEAMKSKYAEAKQKNDTCISL